ATLERDQGSNVWITIAIREGKNREVRNILGALGLEVNRLIRVSYGPFQLGEIAEGEVEEVRARVLRQQLGDKIAAQAGVELGAAAEPAARTAAPPRKDRKPEPKMVSRPASKAEPKPAPKPRAKRSVVEDRKGRKVVVQRTGSDEARERNEAFARGRPQRPKRGYHGKRDLKPRD
ncbi:MAG: pseudouridine synthase, partial [Xanthobacteraceae bacterium]|nr:pseudouridine synthase [Xanthobacteraceae bacterium]